MDFNKILSTMEFSVAKLSIKNKGSNVKIGNYYTEVWNALAENYGLVCEEKSYKTTDKGNGVKEIVWEWEAQKSVGDSFCNIKFKFTNNCFLVFEKENKVLGIFSMEYLLVFDPKKTWRNNSFLVSFLPYYIRYFYRQRILGYAERYKGELHSIEKKIRKLLNMSVFE